jgi:hypothetical protein
MVLSMLGSTLRRGGLAVVGGPGDLHVSRSADLRAGPDRPSG